MRAFFIRKIVKVVALVLGVVIVGGFFYFGYNFYHRYRNLNSENKSLEQENTNLKNQLAQKDQEIESLKKAANRATTAPSNPVSSSPSTGSSIYDKIEGSAEFKALISSALDLMQARDSEHYGLVNSQVSHIYSADEYGAHQEQRNIYIGSVGFDPATVGSYITHEATHVYNVYVRKIYSYGTREQELPCYEAELLAAQRLGAPAGFIASVQGQITYWQSQ